MKPQKQTEEVLLSLVYCYEVNSKMHLEAQTLRDYTQIVDIPKVICRLKDQGFDIDNKILGYKKNRYGRPYRVVGYRLIQKSYIEAVKYIAKRSKEQSKGK